MGGGLFDRWTQSRILLFFLAALLALPLSQATEPAAAKKRFKTVTRTFSNPGRITIPAEGSAEGPADPYPATVQVGGFKKGKIKDVNLVLRGLSHPSPNQVDVLLVAPNDRDAMVMSDVGGITAATAVTLTLDDEAASPLPAVLETGAFQPVNEEGLGNDFFDAELGVSGDVALSVFDGGNPNGTWRLFVSDDADPIDGVFVDGFTLEITAKVKRKNSGNE
jgi:hypothetical protein